MRTCETCDLLPKSNEAARRLDGRRILGREAEERCGDERRRRRRGGGGERERGVALLDGELQIPVAARAGGRAMIVAVRFTLESDQSRFGRGGRAARGRADFDQLAVLGAGDMPGGGEVRQPEERRGER